MQRNDMSAVLGENQVAEEQAEHAGWVVAEHPSFWNRRTCRLRAIYEHLVVFYAKE
jgi:hypothetical protein